MMALTKIIFVFSSNFNLKYSWPINAANVYSILSSGRSPNKDLYQFL